MNKLFPIVLALLFLGCEGKSVNDTIFSANLRKYYFPIEKFIDNPQVYIYKDDVNGYVKDIIKCESFIQKNGDTLFVSTFYNNYWSAGAEWNELCLSEGLINIDSKDSKMISSPLFKYDQKLGDFSEASYYHNNQEMFWKRTFYDTIQNKVIYKDIFEDYYGNVLHQRTLLYEDGIGRVAVRSEDMNLILYEIIDLKTFEERRGSSK